MSAASSATPLHSVALLACLCLLVACSGLTPRETGSDAALPPSAAGLWQALARQRQGDWFQLLNTGDDALAWRLRSIDSASDSIDLQTFIWELDRVGNQFRQQILDAADRGVRVRILVDDSFTARADRALLEIDRHPSVELRVFNPYEHRADNAALRVALNLGEFWRLDHRMHNKVLLVDGRAALLGGRNMADHYFGYHEQDNFRDMELLAVGPVVGILEQEFDDYWNSPWSFPAAEMMASRPLREEALHATQGIAKPFSESREQQQQAWLAAATSGLPGTATLLVDPPPGGDPRAGREVQNVVGRELLSLIDSSERELWLVSAYLVPTEPMEQALQRARQRGVRVRVLTNSIRSNNHLAAHAAYANHLQQLLEMGVEVHELRADAPHRDRYMLSPVEDKSLCLHAKLILVDDDRAFVGSANLDPRSMRINTEMGLVIDSAPLNARLRQLLAPDFEARNAWQVSLDADGQPRWSSGEQLLEHAPGHPWMRLEDWFLRQLPIEEEM